jgi:hypothetical protein
MMLMIGVKQSRACPQVDTERAQDQSDHQGHDRNDEGGDDRRAKAADGHAEVQAADDIDDDRRHQKRNQKRDQPLHDASPFWQLRTCNIPILVQISAFGQRLFVLIPFKRSASALLIGELTCPSLRL